LNECAAIFLRKYAERHREVPRRLTRFRELNGALTVGYRD
jgi:uncharacterized protein (DUF924 family)